MTQTKDMLATLTTKDADSDIEVMLDDDVEADDFTAESDGESDVEDEDGKLGKVKASRRRVQTKKKQFTEDSIRLYLQQHPEYHAKNTSRHIFFLRNIIVSNLQQYVTAPPSDVSKTEFLAHLSRIIIAYLKGELN